MLTDWRTQEPDLIVKEIYHSIMRNDVDLALFYFDFIVEVDDEVRSKLQEKIEDEVEIGNIFAE